ncbi:SDR family NAD(P)-dependent oxidoreductase [Pseudobdellovibrio exovorus]|nr:SDR family NAD(P)-dependent oxidoreductase [Pseudobdellovibrio exovorus]
MKKKQNKDINPYVVITGASAGIGESVALTLAAQKQGLILTARRLDRLKALKKKCLQAGAPDVHIFKLDIQNRIQIEKLSKELKKKKLKVKTLVNNAGLAKGVELLQNSNPDDFDSMVDTNVKGLLYMTRALLPEVIAQKGHIVNLGSVAGRLVYEGGVVYCATKFAVRAISDALRMDLKGTGVRVTNIEPGMVQTEFSVVRLGNQQKAKGVYEGMMPLSAQDVANTILWCLSQPPHVNISELVIYPTDQASVGQVVRGDKSIKNLVRQ